MRATHIVTRTDLDTNTDLRVRLSRRAERRRAALRDRRRLEPRGDGTNPRTRMRLLRERVSSDAGDPDAGRGLLRGPVRALRADLVVAQAGAAPVAARPGRRRRTHRARSRPALRRRLAQAAPRQPARARRRVALACG